MKRTPLRRRARLKAKTELARGPGPERRTRMKTRNAGRLARLRKEQFGDDGYYEDILATPCIVTGQEQPDPAHVVKSRGAGGGPGAMAPLAHLVHVDFDVLPAGKFQKKWGVSKADIRAWAAENRVRWLERRAS